MLEQLGTCNRLPVVMCVAACLPVCCTDQACQKVPVTLTKQKCERVCTTTSTTTETIATGKGKVKTDSCYLVSRC
jgi:hypothetical protein